MNTPENTSMIKGDMRMKKLIAILLTILICGVVSISSAENSPRLQPGDSGTEWRIKSKTASGTTTSGSEQFYSSYTANRDGERHTITVTQKYTASITGQFGVSLGNIEASVGFDHGEEFTVSASTTSSPLSAGETVEAYWQKKFQKYTIQQEQIRWEVVNVGTDSQPILKRVEEVIATKTAYALKPVAPQIRLAYYNTNARGQRVLIRVETINE